MSRYQNSQTQQKSKSNSVQESARAVKSKANIRVTIISALFFNQPEKNEQKMGTYVKIRYETGVESFQLQTKVEMNPGLTPRWDKQFDWIYADPQSDLVFELWGWDQDASEELLGLGKINIQTALGYEGQPFGLEMENRQKTFGTVQVRVEAPDTDDKETQMMRDAQVQKFTKYIQETGIERAFKLIFAEILTKKIDRNEVYIYSAVRLRQIGGDLKPILNRMNGNNNLSHILKNISEVKADDDSDQGKVGSILLNN